MEEVLEWTSNFVKKSLTGDQYHPVFALLEYWNYDLQCT